MVLNTVMTPTVRNQNLNESRFDLWSLSPSYHRKRKIFSLNMLIINTHCTVWRWMFPSTRTCMMFVCVKLGCSNILRSLVSQWSLTISDWREWIAKLETVQFSHSPGVKHLWSSQISSASLKIRLLCFIHTNLPRHEWISCSFGHRSNLTSKSQRVTLGNIPVCSHSTSCIKSLRREKP